jgi:hypothetical protein
VWWSGDGKLWNRAVKSAGFGPRSSLSAAVHNSRIYVANGTLQGNTISAYYSDVWSSADGVNWLQETAAAPYAARCDSTLISYGTHLYMTAGVSGIFSPSYNDVWASTDGKTWTQKTAAAAFVSRFNAGSAVFQGKMWIAGGSSAAGSISNIWCSPGSVPATATHTVISTAVNTATQTATPAQSETHSATVTYTASMESTPTITLTAFYTDTVTPSLTLPATAVCTVTLTQTHEMTQQATASATSTVTATQEITSVPTATVTATLLPPKDKQGIDNLAVYPNPYTKAGQHDFLYFNYSLGRKCTKTGLKVYTRAFRLVMDTGDGAAKSAGEHTLAVNRLELQRLSAGCYLYYIYAIDETGAVIRSAPATLVILP